MGAPTRGRAEVHDQPIRGHRYLRFQRMGALLDTEVLLLVLRPPDGFLPGTAALLLFRLPSGLLSPVDDDVGNLRERFEYVFQRAESTTRSRGVRRDLAAV